MERKSYRPLEETKDELLNYVRERNLENKLEGEVEEHNDRSWKEYEDNK